MPRSTRRTVTTLTALAGLSTALAAAAQPQIISLGVLPGANSSVATGISPDGHYVVGKSGIFESFIFTEAEGMTGFSGPSGSTSALAVSSNGIVAGFTQPAGGGYMAFRWSIENGYQDLGSLDLDNPRAGARDISADGNTIVGWTRASNNSDFAFRWTPSTGMQSIGALPGGNSLAYAVSNNGNWIVGISSSSSSPNHPQLGFRWSEQNGMIGLQQLNTDQFLYYNALDVSGNGEIIVGYASIFGGGHVCLIWNAKSGIQEVPKPAGSSNPLTLNSVNDNGSIAVGWVSGADAVFWTQDLGTRYLKSYLESIGTDLTGWSDLIYANAISSDGTRIVGEGRYEGQRTAFLIKDFAIVPPCPADVTGEGTVNLDDLNLVLTNFGQTTTDGDTDGNGTVNLDDLNAVLTAFGTDCP